MFKVISTILMTIIFFLGWPAKTTDPIENTISLLFMGDIMGHDSQIEAAYNPAFKKYQYQEVFAPVRSIIENADFAIANLEVTLAGPPFKGYPRFASPPALAADCQEIGIDAFITANNHSCDRGKNGIIRTLDVLDSLQIKHTGVFRDYQEFTKSNLMILEKNQIKVGVLNYTYGTNGLRVPFPTIVNLIDTLSIARDINATRNQGIDKLIITLHWGWEYNSLPNRNQGKLAEFLFKNGVDIIIGSHPHVLQPIVYRAATDTTREQFVAYSLGNYVSNMRRLKCDGGVMVELVLQKKDGITRIKESGYHLAWVHKHQLKERDVFEILPCAQFESNHFAGLNKRSVQEMKSFIAHSRNLYNKHNLGVWEWAQFQNK